MGEWSRQDRLNTKLSKSVSIKPDGTYWPTKTEIIDKWGAKVNGSYASNQFVDIDNVEAGYVPPPVTTYSLYITRSSNTSDIWIFDIGYGHAPRSINDMVRCRAEHLGMVNVPIKVGTWASDGTRGVSVNQMRYTSAGTLDTINTDFQAIAGTQISGFLRSSSGTSPIAAFSKRLGSADIYITI